MILKELRSGDLSSILGFYFKVLVLHTDSTVEEMTLHGFYHWSQTHSPKQALVFRHRPLPFNGPIHELLDIEQTKVNSLLKVGNITPNQYREIYYLRVACLQDELAARTALKTLSQAYSAECFSEIYLREALRLMKKDIHTSQGTQQHFAGNVSHGVRAGIQIRQRRYTGGIGHADAIFAGHVELSTHFGPRVGIRHRRVLQAVAMDERSRRKVYQARLCSV